MSHASIPYRVPANKRLQRILDRLKNIGANGTGYSARCPAREDHHNSLSIDLGADGRVRLKDHAGCPVEEIVETIGLRMRDLFPRARSRRRKRPAAHTATPAPVSQTPAKAADAADAPATTATQAEPPSAWPVPPPGGGSGKTFWRGLKPFTSSLNPIKAARRSSNI